MTYLFAKRIDGKLYLEVSEELVSTLESAGVKVVADGKGEAGESSEADRQVRFGLRAMERYSKTFTDLAK